jgi:nitrite reductase/ring-hydroxylating ferredoxin subunit
MIEKQVASVRSEKVETVDVGAIEEFAHATPRLVKVGGRAMVFVRWHDGVFAIRNTCAHEGAPLCFGMVSTRMVAGERMGEVQGDDANPVLACAWHAWEYDLHTGRALTDPNARVATYPVSVENGRVLIELRPKRL